MVQCKQSRSNVKNLSQNAAFMTIMQMEENQHEQRLQSLNIERASSDIIDRIEWINYNESTC